MELTINNLLKVFGEGLGFDIRLTKNGLVKMEIWYWGAGNRYKPSTWTWDKMYEAPTVSRCLLSFIEDMRGVELPGHIDLNAFNKPQFVISKELSRACLDALKDDSGRIKPRRIIEVPALDWPPFIQGPVQRKAGLYDKPLDRHIKELEEYRHKTFVKKEDNEPWFDAKLIAKLKEVEPEDEPWFDEYYDSLPDAD